MKAAFYPVILCFALAPPLVAAKPERDVGVERSVRESPHRNRYLIVVATDGTGDFTSVQRAVDRVPENNIRRFVILIKRGTYQEQIKISRKQSRSSLSGVTMP